MEIDVDIRKTLRSGKRIFNLDIRFHSTSQRIVLYGPSGAGKSLTLKAIAGLITPDEGHIRLGNVTLFDTQANINLVPQVRNVAYVFQDYALFPHLTVRQNIGFGLTHGWHNPHASAQHETVNYWLDTFHLHDLAHQLPGELSGGQRQRTAIARALAIQPKALLLDEPFAALDPALRASMRRELDELQSRLEVPMIIITHDPEDAKIFGEDIFCVREGKIGATQTLTDSYEATVEI